MPCVLQVRQMIVACPGILAEKPLELQRKVDFLKQVGVCWRQGGLAGDIAMELHSLSASGALLAEGQRVMAALQANASTGLTACQRIMAALQQSHLPDFAWALEGFAPGHIVSISACAGCVHTLQELNMELPDLLAHPTFLGASLMQVRSLSALAESDIGCHPAFARRNASRTLQPLPRPHSPTHTLHA